MEEKEILKKVSKRRFFLNRITANKLENEAEGTNVDIALKTDYEVIKDTNTELDIKLTIKVFLEPEALFFIELEYITEIKMLEEISLEEINENIDDLLPHLGSEVSYMISTLTKEIIGSHIILPPGISFKRGTN